MFRLKNEADIRHQGTQLALQSHDFFQHIARGSRRLVHALSYTKNRGVLVYEVCMQLHGRNLVLVRVSPSDPRPEFSNFQRRAAFFRRYPGGDRWHEYAPLTSRSHPKLYSFFHFEGPNDEDPEVAKDWLLKQCSGRSKPNQTLQGLWAEDGYVLSARRLAVAQYVDNAVRTAPEWAPRIVVLYTLGFSAVAYCQEHALSYEIEKASVVIAAPEVVPWVDTLRAWAKSKQPSPSKSESTKQEPRTAWQFLLEGD